MGLVHDDPGRLDGKLDYCGRPAAVGSDGKGGVDTFRGRRIGYQQDVSRPPLQTRSKSLPVPMTFTRQIKNEMSMILIGQDKMPRLASY